MADQPWHELPAEVAVVLRPHLGDTADEMIEAVRDVPAYSRPLDSAFGARIREGVQAALSHLLAEIEVGGPVARPDVYTDLGRGEMRSGRTLESLLSAYRLGARVAWRRFSAVGEAAGLAPHTLYDLAESIFAYIDVLSAESAEGHALEQRAAAGEAELRRRRLARMLVREPPLDATAVEAAAAEAGWELPRQVAVLAIGPSAGVPRDGHPAATSVRLPPDAIADAIAELTCVIVPDPEAPGRRAALEQALAAAGAQGGLGPTVPWPGAALSFARARAALTLAAATRVGGDGLTGPVLMVAREHAGELLLAGDPELAGEFATDRLAPLAGLSAGSRVRLRETLRVWLAEQGRLGPVARRLGVHPQTARYRVARLRELFGDRLDDGEQRFWLELALRVGE